MDILHTTGPEFQSQPANFDDYREFCDQTSQSYRPVGILTPEKYELALQDPTTHVIDTTGGRIPLIARIEYSDGYDIDRCKKLTRTQDVFLLSAPPSALTEKVNLGIPQGSAVIVESAAIEDDANKETLLGNISNKDNGQLAIHDFVDPRIKEEDHANAYMGLYASQTRITEPTLTVPEAKGSLKSAFELKESELLPESGLTLFDSSDLKTNPQLSEALWGLFKDRFQWLGDYHPVSMEDTREVFDEIILSESTFIPAKFVDGELVCAGIVMHDISEVDWLKPATVRGLEERARDTDTIPMYFFGVAAKEGDPNAINNMQEVVHLHCDLATTAGIEYTLTFESSNMSSLYIPRVTEQYINSSSSVKLTEGITEIEELRYWFITV